MNEVSQHVVGSLKTHLIDKTLNVVAGSRRPLLDVFRRRFDGRFVIRIVQVAHLEDHVHAGMDVAIVECNIHLDIRPCDKYKSCIMLYKDDSRR